MNESRPDPALIVAQQDQRAARGLALLPPPLAPLIQRAPNALTLSLGLDSLGTAGTLDALARASEYMQGLLFGTWSALGCAHSGLWSEPEYSDLLSFVRYKAETLRERLEIEAEYLARPAQ